MYSLPRDRGHAVDLTRCCSKSMWGRFFLRFIRLDCWCNMVNATFGQYESAALACPETSGQDRPVHDNVVLSSYHSAVSTSGHPGGRTPLILVVEDDADILS